MHENAKIGWSYKFLFNKIITGAVIEVASHLKIGPGLKRDVHDGHVTVTESGILKSENGSVWMAAARKRYIPNKDRVKIFLNLFFPEKCIGTQG